MADVAAPAEGPDASDTPPAAAAAPKSRSRHILPKEMQARRSWWRRRSAPVTTDEEPAEEELVGVVELVEVVEVEDADEDVLDAAEADEELDAVPLAGPGDDEDRPRSKKAARPPRSAMATTAIVLTVIVLALGGVVGYLGFQRYQEHVAEQQRDRFLAVGEQVAVDLTSVRFDSADADLQRILDRSTDNLLNDLSKRTGTFPEVARANQGVATGKVASAGVESVDGSLAQVLVAVDVTWTNQTLAQEKTALWRMRVMLREVAPGNVKASRVEFVQ